MSVATTSLLTCQIPGEDEGAKLPVVENYQYRVRSLEVLKQSFLNSDGVYSVTSGGGGSLKKDFVVIMVNDPFLSAKDLLIFK